MTSRQKQISPNEEKNNELQKLEKTCEQFRKVNMKISYIKSCNYFR